NWYETTTLRSLQPVYLSTVDSGNLLGCLLTLKQGLFDIREQPLVGDWLREGLADTLHLAGQALEQLTSRRKQEASRDMRQLQDHLHSLEQMLEEKPANLQDWVD